MLSSADVCRLERTLGLGNGRCRAVAVVSWAVYLERRAVERTPDERGLFEVFSELFDEAADGATALQSDRVATARVGEGLALTDRPERWAEPKRIGEPAESPGGSPPQHRLDVAHVVARHLRRRHPTGGVKSVTSAHPVAGTPA
jgi:hypothetical protein